MIVGPWCRLVFAIATSAVAAAAAAATGFLDNEAAFLMRDFEVKFRWRTLLLSLDHAGTCVCMTFPFASARFTRQAFRFFEGTECKWFVLFALPLRSHVALFLHLDLFHPFVPPVIAVLSRACW